MRKLEFEYQRSSWGTVKSSVKNDVSNPFSVCGDKVHIFELKPVFLDISDLTNANMTGLLPIHEFNVLSKLLFPDISAQIIDSFNNVSSLIILSPIPLIPIKVSDTTGQMSWCSDDSENRSTTYSAAEVSMLLDLLIDWLASDVLLPSGLTREVFVVCGGSETSYSSVIRCEEFKGGSGEYSTMSQNLCIKQLYCSSLTNFTAASKHGPSTDQQNDGCFTFSSNNKCRRYTITPIRSSDTPQIGVLTVQEILQHDTVTKESVHFKTNAGCFHLGYLELCENSCKLGNEILPSDVITVWSCVTKYLELNGILIDLSTNSAKKGNNDKADACNIICSAIKVIFRRLVNDGIVSNLFEKFRLGHFGSLQREFDMSINMAPNEHDVTEKNKKSLAASQGSLLSKLLLFLIERVPESSKQLFPSPPSMLIMRLVWDAFAVSQFGTKSVQTAFQQTGLNIRRDDLAFNTISGDVDLFSNLCMYGLAASAIFPHCALMIGLGEKN
jgi:hypothetical protein